MNFFVFIDPTIEGKGREEEEGRGEEKGREEQGGEDEGRETDARGTIWTLVVITLAAERTEQLATLTVLAFKRLVNNFLTNSTQKVFVKLLNWRRMKSQNIKALILLHFLFL